MTLRQLCNVSYAFLMEGLDVESREKLDRRLEEEFDHELTPEQLKARTARRMLEEKGEFGKDERLRASMGAGPRQAPRPQRYPQLRGPS